MPTSIVATDFSPRSDRALRRASLLARERAGELLIVFVSEEGEEDAARLDYGRSPEDMLQAMADGVTGIDGIPCRESLRRGLPEQELGALARSCDASLIVVGPHNRSLLGDMFGAITVERIVAHSPVPVLVANGTPAGPYRKVLMPLDLTSRSRRTAAALLGLGIIGDAPLVLLHLYETDARELIAIEPGDAGDDPRSQRALDALDALRGFAGTAGLRDASLQVEEATLPSVVIVERVAAQEQADLLVVSYSARSAAKKGLLGNLTAALMRHGKGDLLVIPDAAEADPAEDDAAP